MKQMVATCVALAIALACAPGGAGPSREPVVGLPCEGCETVFAGLPDSLASSARIAPAGEPGEAMRIEGVVRDGRGRPVTGIIVYAYHTNSRGLYPRDDRDGTRHGRLRAWARSDRKGHYRFDTIRPGGYPDSDIPQHVHMHIIEPGRCTYYIDDILFRDDPRLTDAVRLRFDFKRGGSGVASPVRDPDRTWVVTRDIVLGENISGYPE